MKRFLLFTVLGFTIATTSFGQTIVKKPPQKIEQNDKKEKKHHDADATKTKGKYNKHKHKHKHKHMHHKKKS